MAFFDEARQEYVVRIVYDGVPNAGKTTNVHALLDQLPKRVMRMFQSNDPVGERTQFFDWLELPRVSVAGTGHRFRCQALTVPGQATLNHRRRRILETADAVVFVCSGPAATMAESARLLNDLAETLSDEQRRTAPIALVVQTNKQDQPGALSIEQTRQALSLSPQTPIIPATAHTGAGVFEAFKLAVGLAISRVQVLSQAKRLERTTSPAETSTEFYETLLAAEQKLTEAERVQDLELDDAPLAATSTVAAARVPRDADPAPDATGFGDALAEDEDAAPTPAHVSPSMAAAALASTISPSAGAAGPYLDQTPTPAPIAASTALPAPALEPPAPVSPVAPSAAELMVAEVLAATRSVQGAMQRDLRSMLESNAAAAGGTPFDGMMDDEDDSPAALDAADDLEEAGPQDSVFGLEFSDIRRERRHGGSSASRGSRGSSASGDLSGSGSRSGLGSSSGSRDSGERPPAEIAASLANIAGLQSGALSEADVFSARGDTIGGNAHATVFDEPDAPPARLEPTRDPAQYEPGVASALDALEPPSHDLGMRFAAAQSAPLPNPSELDSADDEPSALDAFSADTDDEPAAASPPVAPEPVVASKPLAAPEPSVTPEPAVASRVEPVVAPPVATPVVELISVASPTPVASSAPTEPIAEPQPTAPDESIIESQVEPPAPAPSQPTPEPTREPEPVHEPAAPVEAVVAIEPIETLRYVRQEETPSAPATPAVNSAPPVGAALDADAPAAETASPDIPSIAAPVAVPASGWPELPTEVIEAGHAWPPLSARTTLTTIHQLPGESGPAAWRQRGEDLDYIGKRGWRLTTRPEAWRFSDRAKGRQLLLELVRSLARIDAILPPGKTLALTPDRGAYRLWSLAADTPSLADALAEAAKTARSNEFLRLVADAEAAQQRVMAVAEAERLTLRCGLHDLALTRNGPVFLGLVEPRTDGETFDAVAQLRREVLEIARDRSDLVAALRANWGVA